VFTKVCGEVEAAGGEKEEPVTEAQKRMVQDLQNVEDGLTDWEIDFIDNLEQRYWDTTLSKKQEKWLEKIYIKKGL